MRLAFASLVVVAAVLAQTMLAPLALAGALPAVALLVVAWFGYRYGARVVPGLSLIAGFTASFFAINPTQIILAYALGGLVLAAGIHISNLKDDANYVVGTLAILAAVVVAGTVAGAGVVALDNLRIFAYINLMTLIFTALIWGLMVAVARPK